MKAASLLPLLAAGVIAAPALSSNTAASLLLAVGDGPVSMIERSHKQYTFHLYINEYCNVNVKFVPFQQELHVYAEFHHNEDHKFGWDFARDSPTVFALDGIDLSISHDFHTANMSFEYGDCEWKEGDTERRNCGWCDQVIPWEGPNGANEIDCSTHAERSRHRTLTCHLWRKNSAGPPQVQPPSGEDWKGVANTTSSPASAPNDNAVAPHSVSTFNPREVTANGPVPDNFYRVDVTHSEWCENGALKARGWTAGRELNFYEDNTQKIPINLHPGLDLLFGPYSYDQHAFGVEYDGCVWTSEGGWPCGWCVVMPWTLGPLNCQTLQPGYQRSSYRTCYFVDNHMSPPAAKQDTYLVNRALRLPPTPSMPKHNTTFSLLTAPIITTPPRFIDTPLNFTNTLPTPTQVSALASTLTLKPAVIETILPATPPGQKSLILPFHIQVWEYCLSGSLLARGVYTNGNLAQSLDFADERLNIVSHRVPGYAPDLSIGFEYVGSRVRFGYPWTREGEGCIWFDSETWRSCGECREGRWSGAVLECGDERAGGVRVKDVDCSLLLGVRQRFSLDGGSEG